MPKPLAGSGDALLAAGFDFEAGRREFSLGGVPVHLTPPSQAIPLPTRRVIMDDVRPLSLANLINLKLHTWTRSPPRRHDLGDVADPIRANRLDGRFTPPIAKSLRGDYRRIAQAIRVGRNQSPPDDPLAHHG